MAALTDRSRKTRLLIVGLILGGLFLIVAGFGIYGLIIGPPDYRAEAPAAPSSSTAPEPRATTMPPVAKTHDPDRFAESVATALFTWDTTDAVTANDLRAVFLDVADPTGYETNGLVQDLDNYLPAQDSWTQLQEYQTRQWLDIDTIEVPDSWAQIARTSADACPDGAVAYTVTGIRHRAGVWYGDEATSEHDVAFTMFLACPTGKNCVLLRLSALDQPLQ